MQKPQPFLGRPRVRTELIDRRRSIEPVLGGFIDRGQPVGFRLSNARPEGPGARAKRSDRSTWPARVHREMRCAEKRLKLGGGDARERVRIEIAAEEGVEPRSAESVLESPHEQSPFFVWHACHAIVGVAIAQVDVQNLIFLGAGDSALRAAQRVREWPPYRALAAVQVFDDSALDIGRESLVQPKVAPGGVRHQIPRPGVGQFVGDQ